MGGSWERFIRSIKCVLNQTLHTHTPSDEVLKNVFAEAENIVNSRPLTYIPLDQANEEAITPNHFLLGSSNGNNSVGAFIDDGASLKKNWKIGQQMANMFWRRWVREYLPDLTRRTKWHEKVDPLKAGDVVVIIDENLPRNSWHKGLILETKITRSGQVRQAVVKTVNNIITRPAAKLAVLNVNKK